MKFSDSLLDYSFQWVTRFVPRAKPIPISFQLLFLFDRFVDAGITYEEKCVRNVFHSNWSLLATRADRAYTSAILHQGTSRFETYDSKFNRSNDQPTDLFSLSLLLLFHLSWIYRWKMLRLTCSRKRFWVTRVHCKCRSWKNIVMWMHNWSKSNIDLITLGCQMRHFNSKIEHKTVK